MFFKIKKKMRPSSKVGLAMAGPTRPVTLGLQFLKVLKVPIKSGWLAGMYISYTLILFEL